MVYWYGFLCMSQTYWLTEVNFMNIAKLPALYAPLLPLGRVYRLANKVYETPVATLLTV